ncbi:hypothetical protein N0V88_005759 [Collariella sp. IMI 366227]|nr:hypothetical protein N0V88_005759 [Collariella sp. IMI 366227]
MDMLGATPSQPQLSTSVMTTDLLILGLGPGIRPLSPATRKAITNLGMRVEVLDTRNAASQYNMLATERGVEDVAAALVPMGWKDLE